MGLLTLFQTALPATPSSRRRFEKELADRIRHLSEHSPDIGKAISDLNPNLRRTLIASSYAGTRDVAPTREVLSLLGRAVAELFTDQKVVTVGVWDLNSYCSELPAAIELLNEPQKKLAFFPVRAAIHAGLISDKERVRAWVKSHRTRLTAEQERELEENTIAEDFYPQAEMVRKQSGLDCLVGITRSMIAFEEDGKALFNYFITHQGKELLVSTYGLAEYAKRAGRPLEVVVAANTLSIALVALSPKLGYHDETRGCVFDMNDDRDSIVETMRSLLIDEECQSRIRKDLLDPALKIMNTLREYKRTAVSARTSARASR